MTSFALTLQVWDLTRSTVAVGLVALATLLPLLAVGLFGGALIDAVDTRRLVLGCTSALAAVSALLTVQAWLGLDQVGLLYALAAVQSAFGAVNAPGQPVAHPGAAARPPAGARAGPAADLLPGHDDRRPGPGRPGGGHPAPGPARLLSHRHGVVRLRAVRRRLCPEVAHQRKFTIRSFRTDPAFLGHGRFLVHRADPGAGRGVPDRCLRDVLRAADVAVPGAQRGAVRRRPAHPRVVHGRGRRGRHGHRGALGPAQARDQAGRGDAGRSDDLGRARSPSSRSRTRSGSPCSRSASRARRTRSRSSPGGRSCRS